MTAAKSVISAFSSVTAPVLLATDVTPVSRASTAPLTNAVVAICVVLVPAAAVGAVGVPVKSGLAIGARLVSVGCT